MDASAGEGAYRFADVAAAAISLALIVKVIPRLEMKVNECVSWVTFI